jgi:hypothetical protein
MSMPFIWGILEPWRKRLRSDQIKVEKIHKQNREKSKISIYTRSTYEELGKKDSDL